MKRSVLGLLLIAGFVAALPAAQGQAALLKESAAAPSPSNSSAAPDPFAVLPGPPVAADKPARLNAGDWSMIGSAAALRILDYTTTEKAMAYPQYFHESVLPSALVHNKAGFAAFQGSTVVADYAAYRFLVRHHLRSIAMTGQFIYDSAMLFQVIDNYRTLGKVGLR
jgi:hypothetical protein